MRIIIPIAALVLAALVGCATDVTVRSSVQELSGTYYSGDGLGRNVIVSLHRDGTYYSEWNGCLGVYGESEGNWILHGDQISFDAAQSKDLLAGYLTSATTIRYNGKLGFVRPQDSQNDQVQEQLVFLKEAKQ